MCCDYICHGVDKRVVYVCIGYGQCRGNELAGGSPTRPYDARRIMIGCRRGAAVLRPLSRFGGFTCSSGFALGQIRSWGV